MAYNLAAFVPELWTSECIVARNANMVMAELVNRTYEKDLGYGDTLHIPSIAALTAGSVTNDGSDLSFTSIDNQTTTDLLVDQHKHVSFFMTKRDMKQMLDSSKIMGEYAKQAGIALADAVDTALITEASNASTAVGTAGTDLTDAALRDVARAMDIADVPTDDRFLVVYPDQLDALRGLDKLVRADSLGDRNRITKAYEIPEKGYFGEVYGIHIYTSTNVPAGSGTPAGRVNIAFQRSAIALAMQMDVSVDRDFNVRSQRYDLVTTVLYGIKTLRTDHLVKVLS